MNRIGSALTEHGKIVKGANYGGFMNLKDLKIGDPVYINNDVRPYRVKCRDDRFIICTKPYNPQHTVMYFIIDLELGLRGPDNMVFCSGYETQELCEERLKELQSGRIEVSGRRSVRIGEERCRK